MILRSAGCTAEAVGSARRNEIIDETTNMESMKLNEYATFWLDSWVDRKTNSNEIARGHAKAIALHIASLQERIQTTEELLRAVQTDAGNWLASSLQHDIAFAVGEGGTSPSGYGLAVDISTDLSCKVSTAE